MANLNSPFGRFPIYDSANSHLLIRQAEAIDGYSRSAGGGGFGAPYTGRDYSVHPEGSMPWGNFDFPLIPRHEWKERIEEGHAKKLFSIYHHKKRKVPICDQKRTNYCWINAVVGAIMNARARVGLPTVNLSSASAGAPGKRYRNDGGWTGEAIRYINQYGLASHELWPNAAIDRRYFNPSRDEAKEFGLASFFELPRRRFDYVMTCLLMGWEIPVGLMWWGHAVFYNAPVNVGRDAYGVIFANSWGDHWENEGMGVLAEDKATPDEANVVQTVPLNFYEPGNTAGESWSVA